MPFPKSRLKPKAKGQARSYQFEAIGTAWTVELFDAPDEAAASELMQAVRARIGSFDQAFSRFRPDSLVSQMARESGVYELPPDAKPMLELYRELYELSGGAVTPLIGSLLEQAGYDANYSLRPGALSVPRPWDGVLSWDAPNLTLYEPALLDFGAAGKGHLVDIVSEMIEAAGVTSYCVDAGGDMRVRRLEGAVLEVGLENPAATDEAIGVASLTTGSLCGSAGNRRTWANFHHIMDPHALASPKHLAAVWVAADITLLADGLTTALYFVSPHILQRQYQFDYALLRENGELEYSPHFPAQFFTT